MEYQVRYLIIMVLSYLELCFVFLEDFLILTAMSDMAGLFSFLCKTET